MNSPNAVSRRTFLQLTGLSLAGVALAACAVPTAPAATGEMMEPVPLRITHWWGEAFDPAIAAFAEQHPHLDVSNEPAPWDGYHTKVPTSVAAGTAADAMFLDAGQFMVLLPQGVGADLTEHLNGDAAINADLWAIDPGLDTGVNGVPFGLPQWHPDSANIWVNKDLASEAGLETPEWGHPDVMTWNWDDLVQAATATTKRTADGSFEQWGIALGRIQNSAYRDMVWTNGGEFFDDVTHQNPTEARFTDPEFIEAWQYLVDFELTHNVATSPAHESVVGADGPYLSGKVAYTWNWNIYGVMKQANFDWGIIAPPFEKRRANKFGGNSWIVSAASEHKDEAYTYVSWAATKLEGQKNFIQVGTIPAYNPSGVIPEAESESQSNVWNLVIARQAAAVADGAARPYSLGAHGAEIADIFTAEIDLMYNGDQSVEEGLQKAKAQVDGLLS